MEKTILGLLTLLFSIAAHAQFSADDLISVNQKNSKYPGFRVDAYNGLFPGGHAYVWMRQFGGTPGAPSATVSGRLLGTVIYGGHDGQRDVQVGRISVASTGNFSQGNHPTKMYFQLGGNTPCCGTIRMAIDGTNGNVGIGTVSPRNKLDVNGTIRSREVRVEASPWPDYVFEDDYKLPSLINTEQYIKEHKHLPEIPSAEEVEHKGIALGEMNAKLLQKIEELTLHLIAQYKLNEKQSKEINVLKDKINQLESGK